MQSDAPDPPDMHAALRETAEQRDGFRQHADILEREVLKLREQAESYAHQLSETRQKDVETRTEWAAKLDQAQREFSSDMLTRDDLENMRLQLIEETEAPWRKQVKELDGEVASARGAAEEQRRHAERLRVALEAAGHEARAELREANVRHETEKAELRAKLELAEASPRRDDDPSVTMRKLQQEHAAATVRAQKLLEEVEDLRRDNDNLIQLRNELMQANASAHGEAKAEARLALASKESLDRRVSHLQHELDASAATQERLHAGALHNETEMRALRAHLDDAQHALASEKAAGALRLSEAGRELAGLRMDMERRQTEGVRREALLQKSRDELANAAAANEREAQAQVASMRDDEAARVRRLEGERTRLAEQLAAAQSEIAANAAMQRDRADALQGEVAALKAELHGSSLEQRALNEEASRLRRRTDEAEGRLEGVTQELHQARLESSESIASRGRLTEVEAQASVAHEKLQMQLSYVQKEADKAHAAASGEVAALQSKVKHVKKLAGKERLAFQQAEGTRARQIEALKREVNRLRGEREHLRREVTTTNAAGGGGGMPLARVGSGGLLRGVSPSAEVQSLIAATVAAEGAVREEAAALRAAAAGVTAR